LLVNFSQLKPERLTDGIDEYVFIKREQTMNKNAGLKLLVFEGNAQLEVTQEGDEFTYYLLSGRGSLAFPRHSSQSRWTIDPDTAMWVPAGARHSIVNTGEGPFRCLIAHCKVRFRQKGRARVVTMSQFRIHHLVGFISRTVFSPETLTASGATRTIGVDLETLTPMSSLGSHEHDEEILYMLRGKGYVRIENAEFPVMPGSVVYTGPHMIHSVHNTEDDNFQYLVWEFAP
jgi:mannose-6-phosphate isomerase-like protein (cupin superfamily)